MKSVKLGEDWTDQKVIILRSCFLFHEGNMEKNKIT